MLRGMKEEIRQLFDSFDDNKDNKIEADEIHRALQSFGIKKTINQCADMIRSAAGPSSNYLDRNSFELMMLPFM